MEEKAIEQLSLDGGCLVFDFINTIGSRKDPGSKDYLESFSDFLKWSGHVSLMPKSRLKQLMQLAGAQPAKAKRTLNKIRDTRETIYQVFAAFPFHKKPEKEALNRFNGALRESFSHIYLDIGEEDSRISFSKDSVSLEEPLRIILKSAFDVLTHEDRSKIKECPRCGWLFLDQTKNNKRRWCNMQDCGSKDKAARYYQRKKNSVDI